MIRKEVA